MNDEPKTIDERIAALAMNVELLHHDVQTLVGKIDSLSDFGRILGKMVAIHDQRLDELDGGIEDEGHAG